MSGPSKRAQIAAIDRVGESSILVIIAKAPEIAKAALAAAHDPALGLDRSVRLGDVVEWMRERAGFLNCDHFRRHADSLEREFSEPAS